MNESSRQSHPHLLKIAFFEVFFQFFELGEDVFLLRFALLEDLDAGPLIGQKGLECGSVEGNEFDQRVLTIVADLEGIADNSGSRRWRAWRLGWCISWPPRIGVSPRADHWHHAQHSF